MRAKTLQTRRRRNRFFQAAALLILLLGMADLAYPAICNEDNAAVYLEVAVANPLEAPMSHDSAPHEPVPDDCFCCCSHIIGSSGVHLSGIAIASAADNRIRGDEPSPAVLHFFRPPRRA